MKRQVVLFLLAALSLLCLTGCSGNASDPILHLGLNAEIIEVDASNHLLYVADPGGSDSGTFGTRCAIDCSKAIEQYQILYVNYDEEQHIIAIDFNDLIVGDQIILGIYNDELNKHQTDVMVAEQIQLGTQRLR